MGDAQLYPGMGGNKRQTPHHPPPHKLRISGERMFAWLPPGALPLHQIAATKLLYSVAPDCAETGERNPHAAIFCSQE